MGVGCEGWCGVWWSCGCQADCVSEAGVGKRASQRAPSYEAKAALLHTKAGNGSGDCIPDYYPATHTSQTAPTHRRARQGSAWWLPAQARTGIALQAASGQGPVRSPAFVLRPTTRQSVPRLISITLPRHRAIALYHRLLRAPGLPHPRPSCRVPELCDSPQAPPRLLIVIRQHNTQPPQSPTPDLRPIHRQLSAAHCANDRDRPPASGGYTP